MVTTTEYHLMKTADASIEPDHNIYVLRPRLQKLEGLRHIRIQIDASIRISSVLF